jgi:hypothetical protein
VLSPIITPRNCIRNGKLHKKAKKLTTKTQRTQRKDKNSLCSLCLCGFLFFFLYKKKRSAEATSGKQIRSDRLEIIHGIKSRQPLVKDDERRSVPLIIYSAECHSQ